jgi:putative phosphoesterase
VLEQASVALHVGDVTAAAVLEKLRAVVRVEAVHGNMDEPELKATLPERAVVEAEGLRIGLVHDPGPAQGRQDRLVEWFPGCDVIAYGHTHLPEVARHADVWIVNPGSPTERRRAPGHSLAVLIDGEPRLIALDSRP